MREIKTTKPNPVKTSTINKKNGHTMSSLRIIKDYSVYFFKITKILTISYEIKIYTHTLVVISHAHKSMFSNFKSNPLFRL